MIRDRELLFYLQMVEAGRVQLAKNKEAVTSNENDPAAQMGSVIQQQLAVGRSSTMPAMPMPSCAPTTITVVSGKGDAVLPITLGTTITLTDLWG